MNVNGTFGRFYLLLIGAEACWNHRGVFGNLILCCFQIREMGNKNCDFGRLWRMNPQAVTYLIINNQIIHYNQSHYFYQK